MKIHQVVIFSDAKFVSQLPIFLSGLLDNDVSSFLKIHTLIQMIVPPLIFLFSIPISFIHVDVAQYFWLASILINIIIGQKHKIKNLKSLII
jgi:hypothetical protein